MALLGEKSVTSRPLSASQKSEGTLSTCHFVHFVAYRLPGKTRLACAHSPLKPYKAIAETPLAPTPSVSE